MRKHLATLAILAAVGGVSSAAFAAPAPFYDTFNYADGTNGLAGNTNSGVPSSITEGSTTFSNYNVWTATTSHGPDIVSGDLSYSGLPTGTDGHSAQLDGSGAGIGFDRIGIGDYAPGQTIYFSLLVQVSSNAGDAGGTGVNGVFFTGLQYNPSTATNDSIIDPNPNMTSAYSGSAAPLLIRNNGSGQYQFGTGFRDIPITKGVIPGTGNAVAGNARVFAPQLFNVGQTVLLVGKLVRNPGSQDDVASLYVNPNPTGSEPGTADAVSDASVVLAGSTTNYDYGYESSGTGPNPGTLIDANIRSFILRSNSVEPYHMLVDDVRIGTSWTAVTVPEPTSVAFMGLGALGLIRKRRRRASARQD